METELKGRQIYHFPFRNYQKRQPYKEGPNHQKSLSLISYYSTIMVIASLNMVYTCLMYTVEFVAKFDQQIHKSDNKYQKNAKLSYILMTETTYLIKSTKFLTLINFGWR